MLSMERVKIFLEGLGAAVTSGTTELTGQPSIEATIETARGPLCIYAVAKGARLAKPNGTVKYLYGCSDGQFAAVVRQTVKANS